MSHFKLTFKKLDLKLHQPFTISRGTKTVVHNVLVKLTDGTISGLGEAAPNARYGEDVANVCCYLETIPSDFFDHIQNVEQLESKLENYDQSFRQSIRSAKSAVEMAWLDWWGKKQDQPLWKCWEAPSPIGPATSYTIGLDKIAVMQQKVRKAADYPVYKVKLGTGRDREIICALREVTSKPIRVDANEGWTTLAQAKRMVLFLGDKNIELIEQPMPAALFQDLIKLKAFSPLPLCADESFTGDEPLAKIAKAFDIINIKLMKTGSLVKAKKIIAEARRNNLLVMIGCMIESSVANTAGALLGLWADYADLDGHLLIDNDPASGFKLTDSKRIQMPDYPGMGVRLV